MLQLDIRRNTVLWILGITFALGLGMDLVRLATHRDVQFPFTVVRDDKSLAVKQMADSIMHTRVTESKAAVDINIATAAELETLDGIGPVLAQRIISYREQNGPFKAVEELDSVSGIGPKRLAAIRDRCVVE